MSRLQRRVNVGARIQAGLPPSRGTIGDLIRAISRNAFSRNSGLSRCLTAMGTLERHYRSRTDSHHGVVDGYNSETGIGVRRVVECRTVRSGMHPEIAPRGSSCPMKIQNATILAKLRKLHYFLTALEFVIEKANESGSTRLLKVMICRQET